LTPLCQGGGAIEFEVFGVVKMTFLIEMIVNRGVNRGKFLKRLYVPESRHCSFSSTERLVGILRPIVKPATAFPIGGIANSLHCRPI
jgi:hypothetical protein